jgi:hypothetical protein
VHFWKYISSIRKSDNNSSNLEVNGNHLSQPRKVAEAFAEYFQSVFNNPYLHDSSTASQSSDTLSIASVSDFHVFKAITCLRSKSVGIDNIPAFIIKVVRIFLYLFLNLFSTLAYVSVVSLPFGNRLLLSQFLKKETELQ